MDDLEFTGERLVPSVPGYAGLFREHIARYFLAGSRSAGRRVLDAGCGCGYGAYHLMERGAASVLAVDSSQDAIAYAQRHFPHPAIEFRAADLNTLELEPGCFDLITCFEVIEHLHAPGRFLERAAKWSSPQGELWISTPNALTYRAGTEDARNPFHIREFSARELRDLLASHFEHVSLIVQVPLEGELMVPEDGEPGVSQVARLQPPSESLWGRPLELPAETGATAFILARCSHEPLRESVTTQVVALCSADPEQESRFPRYRHELQRAWDEVQRRGQWALDLERRIEVATRRLEEVEHELEERTAWALAMKRDLEGQRQSASRGPVEGYILLDEEVCRLEGRCVAAEEDLTRLGETLASREETLRGLQAECERLRRESAAIRNATFWRLSAPLRWLLDRLRGREVAR